MPNRNNFFDWYNELDKLNEDFEEFNNKQVKNSEMPIKTNAPVVDKTKNKILSDLIIDEKEAIDGYNNAIDRLDATDEITDKAEDVLKHISEEELEHIEELSKVVADEEHEVQTESLNEDEENTSVDSAINDAIDICDELLDECLTEDSSGAPSWEERERIRKEKGRDGLPFPGFSDRYISLEEKKVIKDLKYIKSVISGLKKELESATAANNQEKIEQISTDLDYAQWQASQWERKLVKIRSIYRDYFAQSRYTNADTFKTSERYKAYLALKTKIRVAENALATEQNRKLWVKRTSIADVTKWKDKLAKAQQKVEELMKKVAEAERASTEQGKAELEAKLKAEQDKAIEDIRATLQELKAQKTELVTTGKVAANESLNESLDSFTVKGFTKTIIDSFEDDGVKGYNIQYSKDGKDLVTIEAWDEPSPILVISSDYAPNMFNRTYADFESFASDLAYKYDKYINESLETGILETREEKMIDAFILELRTKCGYNDKEIVDVCRKAGMTDEEINASVVDLPSMNSWMAESLEDMQSTGFGKWYDSLPEAEQAQVDDLADEMNLQLDYADCTAEELSKLRDAYLKAKGNIDDEIADVHEVDDANFNFTPDIVEKLNEDDEKNQQANTADKQQKKEVNTAKQVKNQMVDLHNKGQDESVEGFKAFVNTLKDDIKLPLFWDTLKAHYKDEKTDLGVWRKVKSDNTPRAVGELVPTQNNISLTKSLGKWSPISEKGFANACFNDEVNSIMGNIVIFNNKYIIDGHHRWSKVYLVNPNAKIPCLSINVDDPNFTVQDALKGVQLAIANKAKDIPGAKVDLPNLLENPQADVKKHVVENLLDEVLASDFVPHNYKTKEAVADLICKNTALMAKTGNKGVNGAPDRTDMPQTGEDNTKGVINDIVANGIIDVTESVKQKKIEVDNWSKLDW